MNGDPVQITFDCLPLRSVKTLEPHPDASPRFQQLLRRIAVAIDKHGRHNAYFLHQGRLAYLLTNSPDVGQLKFSFEGTLLTDSEDLRTLSADLSISLVGDTCNWLTEPVVAWFQTTVRRAVMVEFDRYIGSGDLQRTRERLESLDRQAEGSGGFLGMGL